MPIGLSILLVTLFAVCVDLGIVLQKQAADRLPLLRLDRSLAAGLRGFVTSKRWMAGLVVSAVGWGFFVYALTFTPISLARAIQGSGFVALALFSVLFLDHRLKASEWAAAIVVTLGIVALGSSEPAGSQTTSTLAPFPFAAATAASCGACLILFLARRAFASERSRAVIFGAISGVLAGLGDVFTKALVLTIDRGQVAVAFAAVLPALILFYVSQIFLLSRAYQHGRAIVVVAVNDFAARLVAILIGVSAMGEALPAEPTLASLRLGGFAAILCGTVLLARFSGEQLAGELPRREKTTKGKAS